MEYKEKKLDDLWRAVVKSDGRCLFCGTTYNLHAHHIFMGRWKAEWFFRWQPVFGICLCGPDHINNSTAPHRDEDAFWEWLELVLPPERMKVLNFWRKSKIDIPKNPGWHIIKADLEGQLKAINDNWHDMESYHPTFRGRNEKGEEIWE